MDLLSKSPVDEPNIDDSDSLYWFELMNNSGKRQAWKAKEKQGFNRDKYEPDVFEVEAKNEKNKTGYYEIQEFDF